MGFDQQGLIWCVFRPRQRPWSYCVCVCVGGGGGGAETHFLSQLFKIFDKVGGGTPCSSSPRGLVIRRADWSRL